MSVTIKEIAAQEGVSPTTVFRALHDQPRNQSGYLATQHLIERGHRETYYVNITPSGMGTERFQGYKKGDTEAGACGSGINADVQ